MNTELWSCPASLQPVCDKNPWVVSVLRMWEWLCTDFLRYFQNTELKGALYHSLLSLSSGLGLNTRCLASLGSSWPFAAGRRAWKASGVKEMSSLHESYFLGLFKG